MWPIALHFALTQLPATPVPTAEIQHWELDGTLDSAVGGPSLGFEPGAPSFAEQALPGGLASALKVEPGARVRVPTDLVPTGPGFIDGFTVVLDVRLEDGKWTRAPIVQMDVDDDDDAEAEIVAKKKGKSVTFGAAGVRGGQITIGEWHRLAMVVDGRAGRVTHYVDGVRAATEKRTIADSRWSLEPELVLFSDDEDPKERPTVWLSAVQVRGEALAPDAIAALGGASAAGLGKVEPGGFAFDAGDVASGGPTRVARGALFTARWQVALPAGDVELALVAGDGSGRSVALGKVAMGEGEASFHVPVDLPAGAWRVRARWKSGEALGSTLAVDGAAPRGEGLGQELAQNGDFERGLDGWTVAGKVATGSGRAGSGVVGATGDFTVSQVIDLAARGLGPELVDLGLVVEGSAMMTRKENAPRFDDRGELFVRFRGPAGEDLGRLRSLSVDKNGWAARPLRGAVPVGTRTLEVGVSGTHRRGKAIEVGADDVHLRFVADATPAVWRLSKQPIVSPTDRLDTLALVFETDRTDAAPVVVWGPADAPAELHRTPPSTRTTVSPRHEVHEAALGPLDPGRAYRYHVEVGPWRSKEWTVRGPAGDGPFTIAWTADNQNGWSTFRDMLPTIAAAKPDFAVLAGDIVQHGEMLREWQTEWFTTLSTADFGQTTPIWFARGNHDGENALSYAYTTLPGNEAWFAFTRGGVRFIFLDTEADHGAVPQQTEWLRAELESPASRNADLRVVTFHKTPFSNRWGSKTSTYDGEPFVRKYWVPLFRELGVDFVVAGHTHAYQRIDVDGVRYMTVGGAGGKLDTFKTGSWKLDKDLSVHHWVRVTVADRKLHWVARDEDGKVIDEWTMRGHGKAR